MPAPTLRVFIALELPPEALHHLGALMAALQRTTPRGSVRWVRPGGIHLTLKFYGEVSREIVPDLQRVVTEAARVAGPLTFALAPVGAFPNINRPRVVWVGITEEMEPLQHVQRAVEAGSRPLGFEPEARGFNPHLTLGRVNQPLRPAAQTALTQALASAPRPPAAPFTVHTLALMRSESAPGGAHYSALCSATLGGLPPLHPPVAARTAPIDSDLSRDDGGTEGGDDFGQHNS